MNDDKQRSNGGLRNPQFRCAYFTPRYEETLAFYRDGLDFTVVGAWDRGPDDRGTVFQAASGMIEVLALPSSGESEHLWDKRPPQGAFMVIEAEDVASLYQRVLERGLPIQDRLKDQPWGHRGFCVRDPSGLTIYFFSEIDNG